MHDKPLSGPTRRRPLSEVVAESIIRLTQHTPFRGAGGYAKLSSDAPDEASAQFPQAEIELARVADFFGFFQSPAQVASALRNRIVLDLGCGYGGRTAGYATEYGAAEVIGVEPHAHVIERCSAFAASRGITNCRFLTNDQTGIPLPDRSVDVVVSYDVFEHVTDPAAMLAEIHRVLTPGGMVYLVFTPYFGALSHHLNYITRLPGLHWVFAPQTLVNAVNRLLNDGGVQRFGTSIQPDAPLSFNGARRCLPSINGMSGDEFLSLLHDFEIVDARYTNLLVRFPLLGSVGAWISRRLGSAAPRVEEALSFNLVCELRTRDRSG